MRKKKIMPAVILLAALLLLTGCRLTEEKQDIPDMDDIISYAAPDGYIMFACEKINDPEEIPLAYKSWSNDEDGTYLFLQFESMDADRIIGKGKDMIVEQDDENMISTVFREGDYAFSLYMYRSEGPLDQSHRDIYNGMLDGIRKIEKAGK